MYTYLLDKVYDGDNKYNDSLVDVDIPELSPWPGIDVHFLYQHGTGRRIVKELDLKLTLGMAERR